mmetsp:Transcript_178576/g.572406  ORF Transcript_178576/g.572406 Transcript_178576/m.572406 type:complete len:307 (-) Transcript_178576:236-1156(-)
MAKDLGSRSGVQVRRRLWLRMCSARSSSLRPSGKDPQSVTASESLHSSWRRRACRPGGRDAASTSGEPSSATRPPVPSQLKDLPWKTNLRARKLGGNAFATALALLRLNWFRSRRSRRKPRGIEAQICSRAPSPARRQPPRTSISTATSHSGSTEASPSANSLAVLLCEPVRPRATRTSRGAARCTWTSRRLPRSGLRRAMASSTSGPDMPGKLSRWTNFGETCSSSGEARAGGITASPTSIRPPLSREPSSRARQTARRAAASELPMAPSRTPRAGLLGPPSTGTIQQGSSLGAQLEAERWQQGA